MIDRDRPLAFWDTPFLNKSAQRWSFCWCIPLPCRQQELEAQTEYIRAHKDLLPTNVMFFCYQEAVGRCLQVGLKPFKAILSSLTLVPSGMTTVTRRMWLRGQQMFGPGLVSSFYGSCCLGTVMTFWHILAMYLPSVQLPCLEEYLHEQQTSITCTEAGCFGRPRAPCRHAPSVVVFRGHRGPNGPHSETTTGSEAKHGRANCSPHLSGLVGDLPLGRPPLGPPLPWYQCLFHSWDSSPKTRNEILMTTCLWFKTIYQMDLRQFSLFKVDIRLMERKRLS